MKKEKVRIAMAMAILFEFTYYQTFTLDEVNVDVKQICNTFNYHNHSTVKNVILSVKEVLDNNQEYDLQKDLFQQKRKNTFEEHLITTVIESGDGYQNATRVFNAVPYAPFKLP